MWAILLLLPTLPQQGRAHGAAPAALEVLAQEGGLPTLLRANVGMARRRVDGAYEYLCPARWSGSASYLAGFAEAADTVLVATSRALFLSQDGGCHFEAPGLVEALDADGAVLAGVVALASREPSHQVLVALSGDAGRALYDLSASPVGVGAGTAVRVLGRFSDDEGTASSVSVARGGVGRIWVAGTTPEPWLRVASEGSVGVKGELEWRAVHMDIPPVDQLLLRHVDGDEGLLWFSLRRDGFEELWRGQPGPEGRADPGWQRLELAEQLVLGPVPLGGAWWWVADGQLRSLDLSGEASDGGSRVDHGPVDWTCLQLRGGQVFACSLRGIERLDVGADGQPAAQRVFSFDQLAAPGEVCAPGDEVSALCELDWLHHGGEAGWLEAEASTDPELARGQEGPDVIGTASGSCSLVPVEGRDTSWILFLLLVWMRRARHGCVLGHKRAGRSPGAGQRV